MANQKTPPPIPADLGFDDPSFRPRKDFMIVVGILLALGGLAALVGGILYGVVIMMMPVPPEMQEMNGLLPFDYEKMMTLSGISYIIMLGGSGAVMIWLGVGSIMIKRWAARLLHAAGWLIIGFGVIQALATLLFIPMVLQLFEYIGSSMATVPMPTGTGVMGVVIIIVYAVVFLISGAGPGAILVLVYGRKNVELTTRYYDKKPSWTDKTTYRTLMLWLLLAWSFLGTLFYAIGLGACYGDLKDSGLMDWFPQSKYIMVSFILSIIVLGILIWGVAKVQPWSWWATLVIGVISFGYSYWVFQSLDVMGLIEGFAGENWMETMAESEGEEEAEMLGGLIDVVIRAMSQYVTMSTVFGAMIFIGFMIWIKKDFLGDPRGEEVDSA